jgi:hypothetical protein
LAGAANQYHPQGEKVTKVAPADTERFVGAEAIIEEAFVDVFCDLAYGGGWINIRREEELGLGDDHRSDVFHSVQVEFKSCQGRPFLTVQTPALPPPFSYLRNLCRSDTTSNSQPVFKARGRLLLSSHSEVKAKVTTCGSRAKGLSLRVFSGQ